MKRSLDSKEKYMNDKEGKVRGLPDNLRIAPRMRDAENESADGGRLEGWIPTARSYMRPRISSPPENIEVRLRVFVN